MERKTVITIEYNLDNVLEYHYTSLNGEVMKAADVLEKEVPVRTWYKDHYCTDPMGDDIEGNLKWSDVLERMRQGEGFYDIIGVGDSVIRERCFEHLAQMMGVPYQIIYNIWL